MYKCSLAEFLSWSESSLEGNKLIIWRIQIVDEIVVALVDGIVDLK